MKKEIISKTFFGKMQGIASFTKIIKNCKNSNPQGFDYINCLSKNDSVYFFNEQISQKEMIDGISREEKIAKIKLAVENGNYVVDSNRIAYKIIKKDSGSD